MTPSRAGPALLLVYLLAAAVVVWRPAAAAKSHAFEGIRNPLHSSLVATQWQFDLPESVLQKTFLLQGSTGRLKQVLLSLLAGRTVRVGAVGGSITFAAADPEHGGYFGRVVEWLKQAFPKAHVVERNGAIRGSTTMYMEHHLGSRLDPGVDLVFIEFAINAMYNYSTMFYEDMASYERMLRSVLTGSHAPRGSAQPAAALVVNMWRCCRFNGSHYSLRGFHEDTSNYLNILSQYYSVPTILVRNGLYYAYRSGKRNMSSIFREFPPSKSHVMIHPSALGHKVMADIVVYSLYVVLGQLEQHDITRGDQELIREALPPLMVANEYRQTIAAWNGGATSEVVNSMPGWESKEEASMLVFETTKPGSTLRLKLDTRVPDHLLQRLQQELQLAGPDAPSPSRLQVVVYLGLLQSYEHMGSARVSCAGGCACRELLLDTAKVSRSVSVTAPYPVPVSSGAECVLELRCEEATSSGEHKLSLRGVSVGVALKAGPRLTVFRYQPSAQQ